MQNPSHFCTTLWLNGYSALHSMVCQLHGSTVNSILSGNNSWFTDLPWIAPQITLWKSWQTSRNTLEVTTFKVHDDTLQVRIFDQQDSHETSWNQVCVQVTSCLWCQPWFPHQIQLSSHRPQSGTLPQFLQNMPQTCRPCPKKSWAQLGIQFQDHIFWYVWQLQSVLSCGLNTFGSSGISSSLATRERRNVSAQSSRWVLCSSWTANAMEIWAKSGHSLTQLEVTFSVWRKHMKNNNWRLDKSRFPSLPSLLLCFAGCFIDRCDSLHGLKDMGKMSEQRTEPCTNIDTANARTLI